MMAVKEINAEGGVLGEQVEAVVVDPASDWPLFAEKAKQLITEDKVARNFWMLDFSKPKILSSCI